MKKKIQFLRQRSCEKMNCGGSRSEKEGAQNLEEGVNLLGI